MDVRKEAQLVAVTKNHPINKCLLMYWCQCHMTADVLQTVVLVHV